MGCHDECNDCNDCSGSIRYDGPPIDALGINTGDLLEVVIQNITDFVAGGGSGAISTLVDNGNGSYTHAGGDTTGTSTSFITGLHTTNPTAPVNTNLGDTWYDTTTNELKLFTNNGTVDLWVSTTNVVADRFKQETIHHNAATVLVIDPNLHNKKEIHCENIGDLSIDGTAHLGADDYTYLIVNTTDIERRLTFSNVAGAYIRDGGVVANLSGLGFPISGNSTAMVTVTNSGGFTYVNGHFYSIEVAGDPVNKFQGTVTLVSEIPTSISIPTMTAVESLLIYDNANQDITSGITKAMIAGTITLTSNITLTGVQVRVLYSI